MRLRRAMGARCWPIWSGRTPGASRSGSGPVAGVSVPAARIPGLVAARGPEPCSGLAGGVGAATGHALGVGRFSGRRSLYNSGHARIRDIQGRGPSHARCERSMTDPELITPVHPVRRVGHSGFVALVADGVIPSSSPILSVAKPVPGLSPRVAGRGSHPRDRDRIRVPLHRTQQMAETGIGPPPAILLEPEPRNTAPAILAAVLRIAEGGARGAGADHAVGPCRARRAGLSCRHRDRCRGPPPRGGIVTFGSGPTGPRRATATSNWTRRATGRSRCRRFVEKVRPRQCRGDAGRWPLPVERGPVPCAGGCADRGPPRRMRPVCSTPVRRALAEAQPDPRLSAAGGGALGRGRGYLDRLRGDGARGRSEGVVPFDGGWSDLGGWETVWREMARDADGVAAGGHVQAIECRDTLLRSEAEGQVAGRSGLEGMIAVAMPDAVLGRRWSARRTCGWRSRR